MSSFWNTSEGTKATGEVQENNDFAPLAKGDYISMIEEASVDEYQGVKKIKFKARVVGDGAGKNRVLFLNLKCWDADSAKRDKAIQLLVKIFGICKAKLPNGEPDDVSLSQLCDKPISLKLGVWEIKEENKSGNWLINAEAVGAKAGGAPKAAEVTKKKVVSNMPATAAPNAFADMDDDIPF